jgi:hypothetical protein
VAGRIAHAIEQGAGVDDFVASKGGCREQRNNQGSTGGVFHKDKRLNS